MCCVCNLLCKIISFIVSLLFLVAIVLLILWLVGVIFVDDSNTRSNTSENHRFLESVTGGSLKYFGSS